MPTRDPAANRTHCRTYYRKMRSDPVRWLTRLAQNRENYRLRKAKNGLGTNEPRVAPTEKNTLVGLTDEQQEAYEERAAIMEFDGSLSKDAAEVSALWAVLGLDR